MLNPALIADLPLFLGLERRALETLASYGVEKEFASGDVLFRTGDVPWGLYVILEGRVRVLRGREARFVVRLDLVASGKRARGDRSRVTRASSGGNHSIGAGRTPRGRG